MHSLKFGHVRHSSTKKPMISFRKLFVISGPQLNYFYLLRYMNTFLVCSGEKLSTNETKTIGFCILKIVLNVAYMIIICFKWTNLLLLSIMLCLFKVQCSNNNKSAFRNHRHCANRVEIKAKVRVLIFANSLHLLEMCYIEYWVHHVLINQ